MGDGLFEKMGAQPKNQSAWHPIFCEDFGQGGGLYTNRCVLTDPSSVPVRRYYGGKLGALCLPSLNTEISVRNSLIRRYGLSAFSSATYPSPPLRSFSFELLDGTIRVLIDTGTTGSLAVASVAASSGGSAVYTGTFPAGGSNSYVGMVFKIAGFAGAQNNGSFVCTASSTTQLTLSNAIATAETLAATALSTGAVYYDTQAGGVKVLLFAKQPGAGQTCFIAVAGIVYCGDGVDTWIYNPTNANGTTWDWGIAAPTVQPSVTIVPSGASSVAWVMNTIFSTMGLVYDSVSGTVQQLQSVNASGTNTTQFGTSGNGAPAWDQTPGGTTSDGGITWTNVGPVVLWTANTTYINASTGGNSTNPCFVYDPGTKAVYMQWNSGLRKSGGSPPAFKPGNGQTTSDGGCKWMYLGGASNTAAGLPGTWQASHNYPKYGSPTGLDAPMLISEPVSLAAGLPSNQVVYIQASSGATSGAGGTPPAFSTLAGVQTTDGDLTWTSLGLAAWAATTPVSGWSAGGATFSAVKDAQGNFQVCTTTGTTATKVPGSSYSITSVDNAVGANTTYHYASTTAMPAGSSQNPVSVIFSGFANSANNGTFKIVSSTATSVTVANASGVSDTTGTGIYQQWAGNYGGVTNDGSAVWTCVGSSVSWAVLTKWYLPISGFAPPSSSQPYGGASVIDSGSNVEFVINSGKSGSTAPTWAALGAYTDDSGTSYPLSQVEVDTPSTGFTTYVGTGLTGLAGKQLLVSSFTNATNNILITPLSSTGTTLVVATEAQVNESGATAYAKGGLIWYNLEAFSGNSLAWLFGRAYGYSYKSRSLTDYYSVVDPTTGLLPVPPGLKLPLPAPTGSLTGDISSASPVYQIVGADTGAVNTVSGPYSPDPAVDTIVIWRSADSASGAGQMFELTEIPNVYIPGTTPGTWSFQDYLPDTPTALYPGLDVLSSAPVDGVNDPPPAGSRPMAYSFQRIWCAIGHNVIFSEGPDSFGGNPNSQFAASDEFPFLGTVIRAVKTTGGLIVFTTSSVEIIAGGPQTASFYSVTLSPNIGLSGYNALDIFAGEIFFISTDHQLRSVSPSLSVSSLAMPISDQLTTFNPATAYIAFHEQPNDSAIYFGTGTTTYNGSTGWFRCNPRQVPGGANGPEPVWSPFAAISNGCQMLQSIEITPGVKKLLVGSTAAGQTILMRDTSVFTDNGTQYDAYATVGSLRLCNRGEIALCYFLESDFALVTTAPTVSFLLNEIAAGGTASFVPFTLAPQEDPPSIYGATLSAQTYNPFRYYFAGTTEVAQAVHMQVKIDFGTTALADECFNFTIVGAVVKNK